MHERKDKLLLCFVDKYCYIYKFRITWQTTVLENILCIQQTLITNFTTICTKWMRESTSKLWQLSYRNKVKPSLWSSWWYARVKTWYKSWFWVTERESRDALFVFGRWLVWVIFHEDIQDVFTWKKKAMSYVIIHRGENLDPGYIPKWIVGRNF